MKYKRVIMTEEHKQKIKEGRKRAMEERKALGLPTRAVKTSKKKPKFKEMIDGKPVMYITGEEETGFDFWYPLRLLYRPVCSWEGKRIEREIVHPLLWQNIGLIKQALSKYVHLVVKETGKKKKEKKARKVRVFTDEQRAEIAERFRKAREAKSKED
jgi:hypothetical protein